VQRRNGIFSIRIRREPSQGQPHAGFEREFYSDADPRSDADGCAHRHADARTVTRSNGDAGRHGDADHGSDGGPDIDTDARPDAHADPGPDRNADARSHRDADAVQ
jgi:hypothetical protein